MTSLLTLAQVVCGDINDILPPVIISNPIARHVAYPVQTNVPTIVTLAGYDSSSRLMDFVIQSLPDSGTLYETSLSYRGSLTSPITGEQILAYMLPYTLTDTTGAVVYLPPIDTFGPDSAWSSFNYTVKVRGTEEESDIGTAILANPDRSVAGSSFLADCEGWTLSDNGPLILPSHRPYTWGGLNRYCEGKDEIRYTDFASGNDRMQWKFVAPEYDPSFVRGAFGGQLKFKMRGVFGNFTDVNETPLQFITIDCEDCNSGMGLRIVKLHDGLWDGSETLVSVFLNTSGGWKRDPLNAALDMADATECEIAAALNGMTKLAILGDFSKMGEAVAIDDVEILASETQPAFPVSCQIGCACNHNPTLTHIWCCGYVVGA